MRIRRSLFVVSLVASAYVAFVGCGDDESSTPASTSDAGGDSSAADTSTPPSDASADSRSPEYTGSA